MARREEDKPEETGPAAEAEQAREVADQTHAAGAMLTDPLAVQAAARADADKKLPDADTSTEQSNKDAGAKGSGSKR